MPNGWMPSVVPTDIPAMRGRVTPLADLDTLVPTLFRQTEAAGKPRPSVVITGIGLDADVYRRLVRLGVDRMILRLPPLPMPEVLPVINDHVAAVKAAGGVLNGVD